MKIAIVVLGLGAAAFGEVFVQPGTPNTTLKDQIKSTEASKEYYDSEARRKDQEKQADVPTDDMKKLNDLMRNAPTAEKVPAKKKARP